MRVNLGKIKGADGAQGPQGIQGIQGVQGEQGVQGATPTITIGEVTTGAEGTAASATLTGTPPNYILNLVIPRGASGGGDMKASVYAPNREPTDIFAYIDEKGVTFDGGTFTGAVLLRDGAPESDREAVPKSYVDDTKEDTIDLVNGFIDRLNDSEAVVKRDSQGAVRFGETECILSPEIEGQKAASGGEYTEYTTTDLFTIGGSDNSKHTFIKITSVSAFADRFNPNAPGQRLSAEYNWYLVDENNNEYLIKENTAHKVTTPKQFRIKLKCRTYESLSWWISYSLSNFQIAFEERWSLDHIAED